jgi:hypothetical protein
MKSVISLVLFLTLTCFGADNVDQRLFPGAQYFINNQKFGDTNGCFGDFGTTGRSSCGHRGHVSEVTWIFLRPSPEGDVYRVTRKYPADSETVETVTKEVTYSGKPIILWRDDYQKIILRPTPKA